MAWARWSQWCIGGVPSLVKRTRKNNDWLLIDCAWRLTPLQVRMRNWHCDKSLWQVLAKRIYKLLKTWSAAKFRRWPERSFSMLVRVISMLAMQVMVDLVMDLLDKIAMEAASILDCLWDPHRRKTRIARRQGRRKTAGTERMHAVLSWNWTSCAMQP